MSKSDLITLLAQLPDGDARLDAVGAAITGDKKAAAGSVKLWKMGEACREIGFSRVTLWRLVQEKRIGTVEVRKGSLRIPDAEIRRFVSGGVN